MATLTYRIDKDTAVLIVGEPKELADFVERLEKRKLGLDIPQDSRAEG